MLILVVVLVILFTFYGMIHLGTELMDLIMDHKWHWRKHW